MRTEVCVCFCVCVRTCGCESCLSVNTRTVWLFKRFLDDAHHNRSRSGGAAEASAHMILLQTVKSVYVSFLRNPSWKQKHSKNLHIQLAAWHLVIVLHTGHAYLVKGLELQFYRNALETNRRYCAEISRKVEKRLNIRYIESWQDLKI